MFLRLHFFDVSEHFSSALYLKTRFPIFADHALNPTFPLLDEDWCLKNTFSLCELFLVRGLYISQNNFVQLQQVEWRNYINSFLMEWFEKFSAYALQVILNIFQYYLFLSKFLSSLIISKYFAITITFSKDTPPCIAL